MGEAAMFLFGWSGKHRRRKAGRGTLRLETLERRELLTTVSNLNDTGAGSLREAIASGGTIDFQAGLNGTISLGSSLSITSNVAIDGGSDQITIDGGNSVQDINVAFGTNVTLSHLTIANGNPGPSNDGGGIQNKGTLTLSDCTLANNTAQDGGAIINYGTLTVDGCTFSGNQADDISGAGGALWSTTNSAATLTNSTFTGNSAATGGAIEYDSTTAGQLISDTFYNNTASGSETGIVEAETGGELDLTNCTVADNTSGDSLSGAISAYDGTVKLANTIVANNSVRQFVATGTGSLVSQGNNLSSDGSGNLTAVGDLPNTDPLLAPLGNYGGATETMALLPGSPGIDAGNSALAPATDQRGVSRVGTADIGAFESRGFTLSVAGGGPQTAALDGGFAPLIASVASSFGEPVQNGRVTFTAPATGASASFASGNIATIDGTGSASVTPTANASAGSYQVQAAAAGASPLDFELTNRVVASRLVFSAGPTVSIGGQVSATVAAVDASGNLDTSFQGTVLLGVDQSGISLNGATSVAAKNGLATFTDLSPTATAPGASLVATTSGLSSASAGLRLVAVSAVVPIAVPNAIYAPGPNADVNTAEVHGLYQSILGRDADSGGLAYWTSQLASGVSAQAVAQWLWNSSEHRGQEIDEYYLTFLHRPSDATGRATWLAVLLATGSETTVVSGMLSSAECREASASDSAWLTSLYNEVLRRAPADQELQYWLNQLAAGTSAYLVAEAIVTSAESRMRMIDSYFGAFLNRVADASGEAFWQSRLSTGECDASSTAVEFLGSKEYRDAAAASVG